MIVVREGGWRVAESADRFRPSHKNFTNCACAESNRLDIVTYTWYSTIIVFIANYRKFVSSGEIVPRCYGLAYQCWDRRGAMAYPIPINLLVRWGRNLHWWLMCTITPSWADQQRLTWYKLGLEAGRAEYRERIANIEMKMRGLGL